MHMKKFLLLTAMAWLTLGVSLHAQNDVTDGGFEAGDLTVGWGDSWNLGELSVDQSDPFAGSYAGKMTGGVAASFIQNVPVIAGETYRISFSAKWLGDLSATPGWYNGIVMKIDDPAGGNELMKTDAIGTQEWSTVDHELTIPEGVTEIKITFWHQGDAPALLLDEIIVSRKNRVLDGDFEQGDLSVAWDANSGGTYGLEETDVYEGNYSGRYEASNGGSFKQVMTVTPGEKYAVSFTGKWLGDLSSSGVPGWYSGINMNIKNNATGNSILKTDAVGAQEWTTINDLLTVPDGVTEIEIGLWHHNAAPAFIVDNISVSKLNQNLSVSMDQPIVEGNEDGAVVMAQLEGDVFVDPLTLANWTTTNFPEGVSIGSLERIDDQTVAVTLAGNTTGDYDSDITDATITVAGAELTNSDSDLSAEFTFTGYAVDVYMQDDGEIMEEAEDGEVISLSIEGDTLVDPLTPENWTAWNFPQGVTMGSITRIDSQHVEITLSGNTTGDYDQDITNAKIQIAAAEFSSFSHDLVAGSGVTFTAIVEEPSLSMHDDGEIVEGAEDGEVITIALVAEDVFTESIALENWSASNLPEGVSIGAVSRASDTLVEATLFGNATSNYDNDITDFSLTIGASQFNVWEEDMTVEGDVTFEAVSGTVTGLEDLVIENTKVYPNPVTDRLRVSAQVNVGQVKVYTVLGELVHEFKDLNKKSVDLPFDNFETGMYILQIFDMNNNHHTEKLYVE